MAGKKRKTNTPKVKKKKWFPIHAPAYFNEQLLGETYVAESSLVHGKYLTANLSTLAKSMRKQSMNVHFRVTEVKEGKAETEIIGYSLINSALKRLVRRGRDKITDSFLSKTKDKKIIRIKPLIITMNKGTKSLQTAIRLLARKTIREHVFSKDAVDVFADIIDGKIQKQIKHAVKELAPIKSVDIRIARFEENTDIIVTDKDVVSEKVYIRRKEEGEKHLSEEELQALEEARAKAKAEEAALLGSSDDFEPLEDDEDDFDEDEDDEDEEPVSKKEEDSSEDDLDEDDEQQDEDDDESSDSKKE